ncbi:MAG: hypothetical protein GQ528_04120, partial [Woeseiaceae bacterium]|nr:hypothetical protein [Woeseiaceae bacterium]
MLDKMRRWNTSSLLTLLAATLLASPLLAQMKAADDLETRGIYVKKNTWAETMIASRAKLIALCLQEERTLEG